MINILITSSFMIVISSIIYLYYYLFYLQPKKHLKSFRKDWEKFNKSLSYNDKKNIVFFAKKLVWNVNIDMKHIEKIDTSLKKIENEHPEIKKIREDIYNKKSDWNIERPYLGE